jgi:hypothetical protein
MEGSMPALLQRIEHRKNIVKTGREPDGSADAILEGFGRSNADFLSYFTYLRWLSAMPKRRAEL